MVQSWPEGLIHWAKRGCKSFRTGQLWQTLVVGCSMSTPSPCLLMKQGLGASASAQLKRVLSQAPLHMAGRTGAQFWLIRSQRTSGGRSLEKEVDSDGRSLGPSSVSPLAVRNTQARLCCTALLQAQAKSHRLQTVEQEEPRPFGVRGPTRLPWTADLHPSRPARKVKP